MVCSATFSQNFGGVFQGVRDYLGEMLGGFQRKTEGNVEENYTWKKYVEQYNSYQMILKHVFSDRVHTGQMLLTGDGCHQINCFGFALGGLEAQKLGGSDTMC